MESTWNLSFHMESIWNPHGNRMEFTWNIPYRFLVEIPCGMVESTWNIGGKKSPKWVRSQPKHIPCGIRGQGKDHPKSCGHSWGFFGIYWRDLTECCTGGQLRLLE